MALPFSLTQPLRQGQLTVGSGWRAYFAPFNQAYAVSQSSTAIGPSVYDLAVFGKLLSGAPPAGWTDLGYITKFKFTPGSKTGNIIAGYRGAIKAKYRAEVGEKFSFSFEEYSRMALKIATGTQVFNILATSAVTASAGALSAAATPAIAMGASGYVASGAVAGYVGKPALYVPSGSGALFAAGTYVVCDQDYNGTSFGYVGDAGANVFQGAVSSVDYTRMTSDYVASVLAVVANASAGQDALILSQKMVGGGNNSLSATANTAPSTGAKVQALTGFASREGGTSITEWSAVFVLDTIDASQVLLYYPRVAPDTYAGLMGTNLQGATSLQSFANDATFDAMAYDDPLDGETVVRYSAYYPHSAEQLAY